MKTIELAEVIATLPANAHALQPMRILGGNLRLYTAFTFPRGVIVPLNRLSFLGFLADDGSNCQLDVLAENGDIVADFPITRRGFEYIRDQWKFVRDDS